MKRRDVLLTLSGLLPAASGLARALASRDRPHPSAPWRRFEITTTVEIAEPAGRTWLWLPLPWAHRTGYQRLLHTRHEVSGAARADFLTAGHDVGLLRVEWPDARSVGPVKLIHQVATRDRTVLPPAPGSVASPREAPGALQRYLRPTARLPTDGIVRETAQKITRGIDGDVGKARALYEWVVENTTRDPKTRGCGTGDVGAMLRSGYLGGKCADISALLVALARSVRIPARDAYGVRVADSRLGFRCLGKSGDISTAQHCRAELYAAGVGWVPVDPADVRKVVLEEVAGGLPLTDPKVRAARALLFGSWEMNWIAYNHGADVELPGSQGGPIPFLMYPSGQTRAGRLDSLDPGTF